MTAEQYVAFIESGLTEKQINRLQLFRWILIHEGRLSNRLATRDLLRIRQILPPRRRES